MCVKIRNVIDFVLFGWLGRYYIKGILENIRLDRSGTEWKKSYNGINILKSSWAYFICKVEAILFNNLISMHPLRWKISYAGYMRDMLESWVFNHI